MVYFFSYRNMRASCRKFKRMAWFASFLSTAAFIQKLFFIGGGGVIIWGKWSSFFHENKSDSSMDSMSSSQLPHFHYSFSMNRSKIHWIGDLKHNTPINYKKKTKLSKTFIRLNIFKTSVKWTAVVSTFLLSICM